MRQALITAYEALAIISAALNVWFAVKVWRLQEQILTLQGNAIVQHKKYLGVLTDQAQLIIRNRDLARENNRLSVQLKNRQKVPTDVRRAFEYADSKNSPRLDVSSIGRCVCVPVDVWDSLKRSIEAES